MGGLGISQHLGGRQQVLDVLSKDLCTRLNQGVRETKTGLWDNHPALDTVFGVGSSTSL